LTREQIIGDAYESYRRVRKLPADQLCLAVVDLVLTARGQAPATPDERRLVDAFISCGWDPWPSSAAAVEVKADASDWPGWPTNGTPANATASPRGQDGPGGPRLGQQIGRNSGLGGDGDGQGAFHLWAGLVLDRIVPIAQIFTDIG
jgi:hypothetical protein